MDMIEEKESSSCITTPDGKMDVEKVINQAVSTYEDHIRITKNKINKLERAKSQLPDIEAKINESKKEFGIEKFECTFNTCWITMDVKLIYDEKEEEELESVKEYFGKGLPGYDSYSYIGTKETRITIWF